MTSLYFALFVHRGLIILKKFLSMPVFEKLHHQKKDREHQQRHNSGRKIGEPQSKGIRDISAQNRSDRAARAHESQHQTRSGSGLFRIALDCHIHNKGRHRSVADSDCEKAYQYGDRIREPVHCRQQYRRCRAQQRQDDMSLFMQSAEGKP